MEWIVRRLLLTLGLFRCAFEQENIKLLLGGDGLGILRAIDISDDA
ncbi:MAG: hypothetical protein ACI82F_003993 [Planctomycetota bacterium]|jgi:hypothetical protein